MASTKSSETPTSYPARRPRVSPPHPGEFLKELVFPDLGMSVQEVAVAVGVSRQHLHDICAGRKPMSVELAVRIAKLSGVEPTVLYAWQVHYDIWHAEESQREALKAIKAQPRRDASERMLRPRRA